MFRFFKVKFGKKLHRLGCEINSEISEVSRTLGFEQLNLKIGQKC